VELARVTVTGGAGFIGHHLVTALVACGDAVTVIDDVSTGRVERLASHEGKVRLVRGSVLDKPAVDAGLEGAEVVFHLAAIASVAQSLDEPERVNAVNVGGTIRIVEAAARAGARRVVLTSSSAVYGTSARLPCSEDQRADPISPYGAGKLAAEHYLHALGRYHGLATVALRLFNVFGPGQDPASEYAAVVPRFITALLSGGQPVINGSGEISRDYIPVQDVVRAGLLAAAPEAPSGLTCNVATGRATSLFDLVALVAAAAGTDASPEVGPARAGDIEHSVADVTFAREALGFVAATPLDLAMRQTVAWFRSAGGRKSRRSSAAPQPGVGPS
jgi:UDP-glucose 4-epimerase